MYRLVLFLLTFTIYQKGQCHPLDSSLVAIKTNLSHSRAKNIASLQKTFADSGINKRIDSIDCAYVVIHTYGNKKRGFHTTEFYFANTDSVPFLIYQNYSVYDSLYYHSFKSFNELLADADTMKSISKRRYRLVQHYYHGCIRPTRIHAREILKRRLNDYEINFYYNKSNGIVKTQTILPRHFHPFFMKMSGGLF
jgi:hypothetical protein